MAWTADDVETWLGVDVGTLDADLLGRVIDAVIDHADRHYDLTTVAPTEEHDQALIMAAGRLYTRRNSPSGWSGSDDLQPVQVLAFDPDIQRMLSGRIRTGGLFGPSASVVGSTAQSVYLEESDLGVTVQAHPVPVADLNATGTPDATTYLRGDGTWSTPAGGAGDLLAANNLSDLTNAATARTNLGLVIGTDVLANVVEDTTPQLGGTLDANAKSVENLGAVEEQVNTVGATGATETLDVSLYGVHDCTMDQACTFTFSNPAPSGDCSSFTLILRGAFTPTFPASVDWNAGTAPTYASPAVFTFVTVDAGTTWLGAMIGSAFA